MQNLGVSDVQELIPGMRSAKIPLLAPLVIYNMYLTTGLASFRTPTVQWCCREERSTLESVKDTSLSLNGTVLLNHTSKARARVRSFIVSPRSVSILGDRGRETPRFRVKERPCLLVIFQNLPAHRIHILQALVVCSECHLYYTLWAPTRTKPRFGG